MMKSKLARMIVALALGASLVLAGYAYAERSHRVTTETVDGTLFIELPAQIQFNGDKGTRGCRVSVAAPDLRRAVKLAQK